MTSILDNIEIIEETSAKAYIDEDGNLIINNNDIIDQENPEIELFNPSIFDKMYHQLDIREWLN